MTHFELSPQRAENGLLTESLPAEQVLNNLQAAHQAAIQAEKSELQKANGTIDDTRIQFDTKTIEDKSLKIGEQRINLEVTGKHGNFHRAQSHQIYTFPAIELGNGYYQSLSVAPFFTMPHNENTNYIFIIDTFGTDGQSKDITLLGGYVNDNNIEIKKSSVLPAFKSLDGNSQHENNGIVEQAAYNRSLAVYVSSLLDKSIERAKNDPDMRNVRPPLPGKTKLVPAEPYDDDRFDVESTERAFREYAETCFTDLHKLAEGIGNQKAFCIPVEQTFPPVVIEGTLTTHKDTRSIEEDDREIGFISRVRYKHGPADGVIPDAEYITSNDARLQTLFRIISEENFLEDCYAHGGVAYSVLLRALALVKQNTVDDVTTVE